MLWAAVIGAPVSWLALLQVNYVLAYPACATRSKTWIYVSSAVGLVLVLALAAAALYVWRTDPPRLREGPASLAEQHEPIGEDPSVASRHFVSVVALFLTGLFIIITIGTALPPLVLHPCD